MKDVILDTLLDVARLVPFLYLTYLLMEFLEHHAGGRLRRALSGSGRVGPLVGGCLGAIPQCGFSAAASGLYAGRLITTGTLIAVYLSTSDEMLPIMLSHGVFPWKLLLGKIVIGLTVGFAADGIGSLFRKKKGTPDQSSIEDICEREHCHCGDHIALSALRHTLRIAVFLLIAAFLLNTGVHFLGEERLAAIVSSNRPLATLLAAVVGLIPNCAASVVLTELYLDEIIGVGTLFAGLLVNAGVGLLVLFRNNRPVRDSFRILAILLAAGLFFGFLIEWTPIAGWLR